ncbi:MAG: TOBE domain-containing protein [Salinigranum sp.]
MDSPDDRFEAYLSVDGVSFGAADEALLRAIADHGSVSGAASALGRSRARALSRLGTLETAYGPLVERRRGGADGGGSSLTDRGRDLLARFTRLRAALSGTVGAAESVLYGEVTRIEGELALVETPPGTVRALYVDETGRVVSPAEMRADVSSEAASDGAGSAASPDGTASGDEEGDSRAGDRRVGGDSPGDDRIGEQVQVSLRSDAVTLHDPADAPPGDATSARNRFAGTVVDLRRGESVARVTVEVAPGATLLALVTAESVERLGLRPGREVVASFKATATRATPVG